MCGACRGLEGVWGVGEVMFARRADAEDVKTLLGILGFTTARRVMEAVQAVFPDEPIPERSRRMVAALTGG